MRAAVLAGLLTAAAWHPAAAYDHAACLALQKAKRLEDAAACFRDGAVAGDSRAQFNLGFLYVYGQGVAKDEAEAMHWLRLAADNGDVRAQLSLGFLYEPGDALTGEDEAAARRYRAAAERSGV